VPVATVRIFSTLEDTPPQRRRRWASFGIGFGTQVLVLVCVLAAGIIVPSEMQPFLSKAPVYIELIKPPRPERIRLPRMPKPVLAVPHFQPQRIEIPLTRPPDLRPAPEPPKIASQVPPPVLSPTVVPNAPQPVLPLAAVEPRPQPAPVETGVFGGDSASATLNLPARKVQTGGFGSPNGLPGDAQGNSFGNVAKLGSFDLPEGEGYGNGTGGTRGARGIIASAGFGDGVVAGVGGNGGSGGSGRGGVRAGGFDIKPTPPKSSARRPVSEEPAQVPVEILSKPNPKFTEEARKLGLQGEVVLAVVFTASGKLRVLRVVKGLGHGLDESAWRAAEQISFKPAQRDGEPVDFPATLRVVFQLAG
jgi:TonB family protein